MDRRINSILIVAIILIAFFVPTTIYAQWFGPNVSISVKLKASDLSDAKIGSVVAQNSNEYYLTRRYEDSNIAGVISENNDFLYTYENNDDYTSVAVRGITQTWVSNENGVIHENDPLTSSRRVGVATRASNNEAILGYALESIPESETNPVLIKVRLDLIHEPTQGSTKINTDKSSENFFSRLLGDIQFEASKQYSKTLLFFAVIIICIIVNILGFLAFGRIAVSGIYSIGRNPLAKDTIIKTILINIGMVILFTIGTITVALLILRW